MSGEKFVSVSKIIPLARSLQSVVSKSTSTRILKKELVEQMRHRFTGMENSLLAISTLLDPRFKKLRIPDQARWLAVEHLTAEVATVVVQEEAQSDASSTVVNTTNQLPTTSKGTGLWDAIDERVAALSRATTTSASAMVIVRSYLDQKNISRKNDPLVCWESMCKSYEKLVPLVKKHLSVPGTSVPSERLFSKAGELISARRSSLKPHHVNTILFLNKCQ